MTTYYIKKINNGEYKEIEKELKLNINKYNGEPSTLYFDVKGQEMPFLMDYNLFFDTLIEQIQKGLLEQLEFDRGIIITVIRDGNIIKKYSYDFNWEEINNTPYNSKIETLKSSIYKIVSLYKENPNSSITSDQKYTRLIYDILDGDRIPKIDNKEELLRIFEVYNAHKKEFLTTLLQNVIFCDSDNNIIDYRDKLRLRKIEQIRYDVFNQMETSMLLFVLQNDANDLYQDYQNNLYIPRIEVVYKYYDEEGNEIETIPEVAGGTIFSLGKDIIEQKLSFFKEKVLKRTKK